MYEKKATFGEVRPERVVKRIHEELAFIGRQLSYAINPNTTTGKKLEIRKEELRKELKKYPKKADNPNKKVKPDKRSMHGVNTIGNIIYQHYYKK